MTKSTKLQLGEYALLISFMRVKIGKEFEVAERLSHRFSGRRKISYYTCYGQYDLIEFLMLNSYEEMNDVPFDIDIIDCEFSLFYSWENISYKINEWAKDFPTMALVLLKIHPSLEEKVIFHEESNVINYIKKTFAENANIFAGMGRSEILLLLRGKEFEQLLSNVTKLRQETKISMILKKNLEVHRDPDLPVFVDTTTFPLIAHPILIGNEKYNELENNILPIVNIICNPGHEEKIMRNKMPSCSGIYNHYGSYDITMVWENSVHLSQFAKELTGFRQTMSEVGGIKNTKTTILNKSINNKHSTKKYFKKQRKFKQKLAPGIQDIIKKVDTSPSLEPIVRSQLLEFFGRFNSCYIQEESKTFFEDMTGIHHSIEWQLEELKAADEHYAHRINSNLSEIIDLCNNALYQRYAGLETYSESCKHLPFPFLRGINGFITAATCIPAFIFKAVLPDLPIHEAWPGFVLFGLSYSYQLCSGKILSYPASFLHRPIEDWLGITHEVAHAIYRTFDFFQEELPHDIKKYLEESALTKLSLMVDIEEIYANWFDYKYIFKGDRDYYFPIIWKSWLRWERVWQYKDPYLLRSFIIFITSDINKLIDIQNKGIDAFKKYLISKFNKMKKIIEKEIKEFSKFMENIDYEKIENITEICLRLEPLLSWLENNYFSQDIFDRINQPYPKELIKEHIASLEAGLIITENIPNPIELLHRMHAKYPKSNKAVPLKITAATILTLWLNYLKEYRK